MLRMLEMAFALVSGALSACFGILAIREIYKYLVHFHGSDTEQKIRGAKLRAKYLSISVAGFFMALAATLADWTPLLLMPFFVGLLWLDYAIFRSVTLRVNGRSR